MSTLLKFYNEQCSINIPDKYEEFKSTLCTKVQFPNFNELVIFYIDSDGDKIIVGNEMDFNELKRQIIKKEVQEIEAEIMEGNKLQIPNIVKEEVNPNSRQPLIIEHKKQEEKEEDKLNSNEFIIKEHPKVQSQQQNEQTDQKIKELAPLMIKANEIQLTQQDNRSNDNNTTTKNTNQKIKQNDNMMMEKQIIVFNVECSICHEKPIKIVLYLCEQCNMYLCPNCETIHGPSHRHPFLKIRKPENVPKIGIKKNKIEDNNLLQNKDNEQQSSFIEKIKQIPNAIKNLFHDETKDPQYLIKVARAHYDLKEISDYELLRALKTSKGNIDEAIILLAQEK